MTDLSRARRTILCVDADPNAREPFGGLMGAFDPVYASNAFEALRAVNQCPFHAYVIDYWLPDLSGPALCREIRKIDPYRPIVFCTAALRDADKARALRAGASAYLYKPVEPALLRSELNLLLSRTDMDSMHARGAEEQAIQDGLQRRRDDLVSRVRIANALATQSVERTARAKAYKAYIEARGTPAHFESRWPQAFSSAKASLQVGPSSEVRGPAP